MMIRNGGRMIFSKTISEIESAANGEPMESLTRDSLKVRRAMDLISRTKIEKWS